MPVCLSVRPSVCETPVWYQNEQSFYIDGQCEDSRFYQFQYHRTIRKLSPRAMALNVTVWGENPILEPNTEFELAISDLSATDTQNAF